MADRLWTGATCRVGFPARAAGFPGEGREELKPTAGKGERGYRGVGVNSDGKFGAAECGVETATGSRVMRGEFTGGVGYGVQCCRDENWQPGVKNAIRIPITK